MKIGIVTYWKSTCNYGEQLQDYALQEYLKRNGHEPFLICYDYENDTVYGSRPLPVRLLRACNPVRLTHYFKSRRNNRASAEDAAAHPRGFEEFRNKYLRMSKAYPSIDALREDPPEADVYITGSDQVWNTFDNSLIEVKNRLSAFFLDFGNPSAAKLSYAASWGREEVPEDEQEFIRPLLAGLDAVSVREVSGITLCSAMGREDAVLALDPVALLDAGTYRELYRNDGICAQERRYLLFYHLGKCTAELKHAVFEWASSGNLEVIYVTDDWHDDRDRSFPGVTEWLSLIDNAEYVVTNSYHCSLFSLIFGKCFGVLRREDAYKGMNSRMDTLFDLCGISPRYIAADDLAALDRPAETVSLLPSDMAVTPDIVIQKAVERAENRNS